ncbi:MAG: ABC transporter permease, partial [Desulfamplus sp.]|nr:ABC transporter permease [Desulfamplus sp.]
NQGRAKAWISRDIAIAMNLTVGSTLKIGDKEFVASDIVTPPPDASVSSIELAPKIYIGLEQAQETGLLKFGSRISFKRFYKFASGTDVKAKTVLLRSKIHDLFNGSPIISIYDSEDVNQNLNRIFGYFTGYMGLIGVVALFLAGIGTAYLFRGYLNTKIKEIAILMSLGAKRVDAYMLFMLQVISLGAVSTIFSVMLSFFILPLFPEVLQGLIPPNFRAAADIKSIFSAFIPGIFGSIIFCLPVFVRIHTLKPVILLQGGYNLTPITSYVPNILSFLPAILTFWLLSVGQTKSFERGTIFFLGTLSVMAVMTVIGWLILILLKRLSSTKQFIRKIAFRNLYRNKTASISCFVTIAMGAFLINIIPQIKNGIQDEISQPKGMKIPGFFLIDIQPEQLTPLTQFLELKEYALTNISPIVRGRILNVNGEGFYERLDELDKRSKEIFGREKRDDSSFRGRYRRREFNFSYREQLDKSEKIVKGKPLNDTHWSFEDTSSSVEVPTQPEKLTKNSNQPLSPETSYIEISLEEGFADRFSIKIGDIMEFDIQGMQLKGRVVNLRKVKWNSFQPNFFILFQKGVLDDAPKTFLASIPQMIPEEKQALQNELVKSFPNISVLDVNQTVKQIINITDRLTFAINFMASLAILAGLVVLFSIARHETHGRSWEINLLKVLGAGFGDIRKIVLLEFGFLGFLAGFFATIVSLIVSYMIAWFFFERLWSFRWEYSLFCLIAITLICVITAMLATGKVIRQKSAALLSES